MQFWGWLSCSSTFVTSLFFVIGGAPDVMSRKPSGYRMFSYTDKHSLCSWAGLFGEREEFCLSTNAANSCNGYRYISWVKAANHGLQTITCHSCASISQVNVSDQGTMMGLWDASRAVELIPTLALNVCTHVLLFVMVYSWGLSRVIIICIRFYFYVVFRFVFLFWFSFFEECTNSFSLISIYFQY